MAGLGFAFDASTVDPSERPSFENLPPGDYTVQIIESEMKDTSKGGQMLKLTLEVVDGPNAGRKIWDNLNLVNSNEVAARIAAETLSAICRATGQLQVSDSEQLHGRPMVAKVIIEPARGQYQAQNRVKSYSPRAMGAPQRPSFSPAPAAQAAPAFTPPPAQSSAPAKAPWQR